MSLNIEVSALTQRNQAIQADNASLLQRWIDKMNSTAEEMNEEFEKEQAEDGREGKNSDSAKGKAKAVEGDFRKSGKA
jgi:hypothetical protein